MGYVPSGLDSGAFSALLMGNDWEPKGHRIAPHRLTATATHPKRLGDASNHQATPPSTPNAYGHCRHHEVTILRLARDRSPTASATSPAAASRLGHRDRPGSGCQLRDRPGICPMYE